MAKMQNDDVSRSNVNGEDELTVCPSLNTYYSDRQAAAARAVNDALTASPSSQHPKSELEEDDLGFEFSILSNESFFEGEIGRIFPIFDRDLVGEATRASLKVLFPDESESESETDQNELNSVEPGTYCVWKPKTTSSQSSSSSPQAPTLSPKSKSTGSCSKRWRLRDLLLRRSNSDGKDSFVYLTTTTPPSSSSSSNLNNAEKVRTGRRGSAHELFYVEKRAVKDEDRRRSYLPYRKGLLGFGFFPNGMGVSNNLRPFRFFCC